MRIWTFVFLLVAFAFSKPLVVYTGVYSVGGEKSLGDVSLFVSSTYTALSKLQMSGALSFDLVFETDAEETKHLAADPISMAILLTRNDLQIEHFKKLGVTKTIQNLGFSVLFYQNRKTEAGSMNVILASIPLNSYMSNEKTIDMSGRELDRGVMMAKIANELLCRRFPRRVKNICIDEINVNVECEENVCYVKDFKKFGLELGQNVTMNCDGESIDAFIALPSGALEFDEENAKQKVLAAGSVAGSAANLKGFSDETWQVVKVDITSKKADKLFSEEPIRAQIAQWYSDFLSGTGKAVLPPVSGLQWVRNSVGYTEMILANADGELEKFVVVPARYNVSLGFSGVGSGIVEKNKIEELWAYKLWLTQKVNSQKEREDEFTTSKKVTVATQDLREVDVFRDLLHASVKKLAEKGE